MILVTLNLPRQIVVLTFIGHVTADDLAKMQPDFTGFVSQLSPGFMLLTDLSSLDHLDKDCLPQLAANMDLCHQRGIGSVIRVIPDPLKDIGFSILSVFHYPNRPRTVTCKTMLEAASAMSLQVARVHTP
jgi:anti-anti-sigma regulatory factor